MIMLENFRCVFMDDKKAKQKHATYYCTLSKKPFYDDFEHCKFCKYYQPYLKALKKEREESTKFILKIQEEADAYYKGLFNHD